MRFNKRGQSLSTVLIVASIIIIVAVSFYLWNHRSDGIIAKGNGTVANNSVYKTPIYVNVEDAHNITTSTKFYIYENDTFVQVNITG